MGAKRLHRETAGQPQNRLQKYYIRDVLKMSSISIPSGPLQKFVGMHRCELEYRQINHATGY